MELLYFFVAVMLVLPVIGLWGVKLTYDDFY